MMKQKKNQINPDLVISITKFLLLSVFVVFIISRIWYLTKGPVISLIRPDNNSVVKSGIILLQGKAPTATNILISGISIPVDTEGVFTYDIYVPKGLTKIPILAKNRYGTTTTEELVIWGE